MNTSCSTSGKRRDLLSLTQVLRNVRVLAQNQEILHDKGEHRRKTRNPQQRPGTHDSGDSHVG